MNSSKESLAVEVRFEIEKDANGYPKSKDAETLLCKPLNPECSICVVASVPFYLRGIAYGDTIRTVDNSSGFLQLDEIVSRGGYSVFRILLHDPTKKEQAISKLLSLGALVEHDQKLIAIAVPPTANLDAVVEYILEGKRLNLWGAQDGYIFEKG
jgi:hypothetical protein